MHYITQLIQQLCPNGVAYAKLKNCTNMQRGKSLTKKNAIHGIYPVISGGKEPAFYCNQYNREGETITIAGSGSAGFVQYWHQPIFVCDAFSIKAKENVLTKYIYYYLTSIQQQIYSVRTNGMIPHIYISSIENFEIPIPPIEVQIELVRILDKFTNLIELLNKELILRKKQYAYYRNHLLTFNKEPIHFIELSHLVKINRDIRVIKKQLSKDTGFPVYQNSMIPLGYHTKNNCVADTTFIISAGSAGEIGYSKVDFWAADDCFYFECPIHLLSRYLYFALLSQKQVIYSKVRRASIPRLARSSIEKLKIPVPPLEEQKRIVSILDKFDTLCNDLKNGIPSEIEARKKQYNYYRDNLFDKF